MQVNYPQQTPCLLKCEPPKMGPDADGGGRKFELLWVYDQLPATRLANGARQQRAHVSHDYAVTAENPLMFEDEFKPGDYRAAMTAHEVGFEMGDHVVWVADFTAPIPNILGDKQLADEGKRESGALGGYSLVGITRGGNPAVIICAGSRPLLV